MSENDKVFGAAIPRHVDLITRTQIRGQNDPAGAGQGVVSPGNIYYGDSNLSLPPGSVPVFLDPFQFIAMLTAIKPWRRPLRLKPFIVGVVGVEILPADDTRTYFMIINTSAANRIFVGFDAEATASSGIPLEINLGTYEPEVVPSNAIYVTGGGAGTTGVVVYAN